MERKYVLFSPVGKTDPWRNGRDGALLHIVRHYQPEHVTLFFTESLWEGINEGFAHKEYDWETIIKSISPNSSVDIVVKHVDRPHDYDGYMHVFRRYFEKLEEMFPHHTILLNVTSGTPQMGTTLCLEYITFPDEKICIQVASPRQASNIGVAVSHPDRQKEDLAIVNENEKHAAPRYKELEIRSFHEAIIRGQMKSLIANFDYGAALRTIEREKGFRNRKVLMRELREMTEDIQLHRVFEPIRKPHYSEDLEKALFHYLLLEMHHRREDVAEVLIRVKSIAEFIIEKYIESNHPNVFVKKQEKLYLALTEENRPLIDRYKRKLAQKGQTFRKDLFIGLPALIDILEILEGKSTFYRHAKQIEKINSLRNKIAHRLEPLNLVENKQYKMIDEAVKATKQLLVIQYPNIDEEDFRYLHTFNKKIEGLL